MAKWVYLKGAKKIPRTSANGHEYIFSEGPIAFPDSWDRPARTMLTSESTLNRSTHVVCDPGKGRLRILTPVETERIQGFDDNWTNSGMPDRMRLYIPIYLVTSGLETAIAWWLAGISFDLLHAAGNFILTLLLFVPLDRLFEKLKMS